MLRIILKNTKTKEAKLYVACYDTHYPKTDWDTFNVMLSFLESNDIAGFIWGGDQMDLQEISPHTKGKARLRAEAGTVLDNAKAFDKLCLSPVELRLGNKVDKYWIDGNHDAWMDQLIDEKPEFAGLETHKLLNVVDRGWEFIECGKHLKLGKLTVLHGEQLSGLGNQAPGMHSKKAVEAYCTSVLYGHFHSPQSFTKVMPYDDSNKWMSWCSPITGNLNPVYLRNRPTAWSNGFTVIELRNNGRFNVYPVIVFDGEFSFGGKIYKV